MNFLKTGKDIHKAIETDDLRRQAAFQPFRFYLKEDTETKATFIDGTVDGGLLYSAVAFVEHMTPRAGSKGFDNFCCTAETEECPICASGDRPSLVHAFTVIDHTEWKDKDGKLREHQRRLYVCKGDTFKRLQMKVRQPMPGSASTEPMGIAGVTFNIARIGKKSPGVGSDYDFVAKNTLLEIAVGCGMKIEEVQPLDYSKAITYLTADELRKIGFGHGASSSHPVGSADSKALGGAPKESTTSSPFKSGHKPFSPANEL
jgi:hypothetical protein